MDSSADEVEPARTELGVAPGVVPGAAPDEGVVARRRPSDTVGAGTTEQSAAGAPVHLGRAWALALALAALAAGTTWLGNVVILSRFPDRPRPDDLLFELLPYVPLLRYLTLTTLVIGFALFLADVVRRNLRRLPALVSVIAVMYTLRAGLMVLTPLASSQGDQPFVFAQQQYGMFPSGHVAVLAMLVMLTPADHVRSRRVQQVMLALMCASLVLAHGHYSVDVVGGLLLSYFVVQTWRAGRLLAWIKGITGP